MQKRSNKTVLVHVCVCVCVCFCMESDGVVGIWQVRACDGAALRRFNGGVGGFGEVSGRFRGSFGEASVMRW